MGWWKEGSDSLFEQINSAPGVGGWTTYELWRTWELALRFSGEARFASRIGRVHDNMLCLGHRAFRRIKVLARAMKDNSAEFTVLSLFSMSRTKVLFGCGPLTLFHHFYRS